MYLIPLDPVPGFSPGLSKTLVSSGWSFSPSSGFQWAVFVGGAAPPSQALNISITDYSEALPTDAFTQFFVRLDFEHTIVYGEEITWLSSSGPISTAPTEGYELVDGGLNVVETLTADVSGLPVGSFSTKMIFEVYGRIGASPTNYLIDTVEYEVRLRKLNDYDVYIVPQDIAEFSHIIDEPLPATKPYFINVNGSFEIRVSSNVTLTGAGLTLDSDLLGVRTYSGSDSQTINVGLEREIEDVENSDPYIYYECAVISDQGGVDVIGIKVFLFENANIFVSPNALEFSAIIGVREAIQKSFQLEGAGAFTISHPDWLEVLPTSGENSTRIFVQPVPYANLAPGTYEGSIVVTMAGADVPVSVTHVVLDTINPGVKEDQINFTGDRQTISRMYGDRNSDVKVELEVDYFPYGGGSAESYEMAWTYSIFKKSETFWAGRKLDQIMFELTSLSEIGYPFGVGFTSVIGGRFLQYYDPSISKLRFTPSNRETGALADTVVHENIRFIKGPRCNRFNDKVGILDHLEGSIRVTPKTNLLFNFYKEGSSHQVVVKRNEVFYTKINHDASGGKLFGMELSFMAFNPGDVIDVIIGDSELGIETSEIMHQRYIVFPEGMMSYHIAWETPSGVLQVYEFTGSAIISGNHEAITTKQFYEYLTRLKKLGDRRSEKFVANTGYILKLDRLRIDQLVSASNAWLIREDGSKMKLVPVSKEVLIEDDQLDLYQYSIEFEINRTDEFEDSTL